MRRLPVVGWLAVVVLAVSSLVSAAPAQAHASQIGSTPAAGAVLDEPPAEVVVEFDSPLLDIGAAIVVRTSDGIVVSTGAPILGRRTIAVAISPDAPDGVYTAAYRVVSQDGHTVESTFDFQVGDAAAAPTATAQASTATTGSPTASEPAASAAAAPAADTGSTDGHSALVWIIAGLALLVAIGVGTVLLRR